MKLHLPKKLLAAVLACVFTAGTAYAEVTYTDTSTTLLNVININFAGDKASTLNKTGEVSLPYGTQSYSYTSSAWTTVSGADGTETVYDTIGNEYTLSWNSPNTWSSGVSTDTLAGAITKGYLDMGSNGSANFSLAKADNSVFDWKQVNIIFSGDSGTSAGAALGKVAVNQTEYYYDENVTLTIVPEGGNPTWGTRPGSTTWTEGTNMMCVPNSANGTQQTLTVTGKSSGSNRATIAGAQIVLGEVVATATGTLSGLEEGTNAFASELGLKTVYSDTFTVNIAATADVADDEAVLKLDQKLSVGKLSVNGGALRLDVAEGNTFRGNTIEVGANASLALDATGNAVSVNSLTLNDGASTTVKGDLTFSGTVTNTGTGALILKNGASVTIGSKLASGIAAGTFQTETGSTLSIAGDYTAPADFTAVLNSFSGEGTLRFVDAQTDLQPGNSVFSYTVTGKKVIFDHGIVFTGKGGETQNTQEFIIGNGAEVTVNNAALEARRMNVNVETGGKLAANAGILIGHQANGTHLGWVNLKGGEIVTTFIKGKNNSDGNAFRMTGGTLTITGEKAFGLTADGKKLKVELQGGTVTTTASQMDLSGNSENGNLVFTIGNVTFKTGDNQAIDLNHDFTQTGTLTVTGSGTLTISGNVTVDDIGSLTSVGGYTDKTETGNGYAGNQRYLIAKGDTDGTPGFSLADSCVVTVAGENVTEQLQKGDGGVYLQTEGNDYTYYINSGNTTYGDTANHNAAAETTTGLSLNGGSLTLDTGLTEQAKSGTGIVVQQAAEVSIDKDVTLSQSHLTAHATTTLAGSGTYDLGAAISLSENVTLASDWTGTVTLSGIAFNEDNKISDLSNLGTGGSTVEVSASAGYINGAQNQTTTVSSNLRLMNGGSDNVALKVTDGYSGNILSVTGSVSGDGILKLATTTGVDNLKYTFSGDVSGWNGQIVMADAHANSKTFHVTFAGTSDVKVGLSSISDTLNVIVSGDKTESVAGKTISSAISQSEDGTLNLTSSGSLEKTFTNTVEASSISISGGAVTFRELVTTGALTVGAETTMSSLNLSGEATLNADLTVSGSTTLATTAASITIGNGVIFTTDGGVLKVTGTGNGTQITTGAANAEVTTANDAITIANAAVTVDSANAYTLNAKLSGSTITNTGLGEATVKVEENSTNSFDASDGSVTVNTGTSTEATVGELNVGEGQSATFTTETEGAAVTAKVTVSATVAGTVSANVNVAGASESQKATFTAGSGATVGGDLTVDAATGSLVLTTVSNSGTEGVLSVVDTLTATLTATTTNIVLADSAKATINSAMAALTNKGDSASVLLAKAGRLNIEGLGDSGTVTHTAAQLGLLGITPVENVSYTLAAASTFSRAAESYLTLTGTYTPAGTPDTLTATVVGTGYEGGVLTIGVAESLDGVTGNFNVTVGEDAWQAIVDGMAPNGGIYQNATVTLTGADGTTLDLATYTGGAVTLNKYAGTGTQGEYFVAYIPEPATATLSLLALAALAARRRRK